LFVFYQFERPPVFFNQVAWEAAVRQDSGGRLQSLEREFLQSHDRKRQRVAEWLDARRVGDGQAAADAQAAALTAHQESESIRLKARTALQTFGPAAKANDADYVFVTFILRHLPHGLIGLLVAAFFAATLSSKAGELNALGSTTVVDVYRHVVRRDATDAHYLAASRWFTVFWGLVAITFALFANMVENLIQAVNIVGSIFYGVVLGMFLVAFGLRRVGGTAVFIAAILSQVLVIVLYFTLSISYLWYNVIGCVACILLALLIQLTPGLSAGRGSAEATS
jgi:uncharacterized sodium:solute symporter family permease YidK